MREKLFVVVDCDRTIVDIATGHLNTALINTIKELSKSFDVQVIIATNQSPSVLQFRTSEYGMSPSSAAPRVALKLNHEFNKFNNRVSTCMKSDLFPVYVPLSLSGLSSNQCVSLGQTKFCSESKNYKAYFDWLIKFEEENPSLVKDAIEGLITDKSDGKNPQMAMVLGWIREHLEGNEKAHVIFFDDEELNVRSRYTSDDLLRLKGAVTDQNRAGFTWLMRAAGVDHPCIASYTAFHLKPLEHNPTTNPAKTAPGNLAVQKHQYPENNQSTKLPTLDLCEHAKAAESIAVHLRSFAENREKVVSAQVGTDFLFCKTDNDPKKLITAKLDVQSATINVNDMPCEKGDKTSEKDKLTILLAELQDQQALYEVRVKNKGEYTGLITHSFFRSKSSSATEKLKAVIELIRGIEAYLKIPRPKVNFTIYKAARDGKLGKLMARLEEIVDIKPAIRPPEVVVQPSRV
ncbi:MAG: hypothetical protein NTZ67_00585 [Gammaproteobacteria bacterium]|nr:hypothetical protein [Gammaproteobacteria bacterium]